MKESNFTMDADYSLSVTVPIVYNKCNVATGTAVAGSENSGGYKFESTDETYNADAEVAHFYVLGNGDDQPLKLWYNDPLENPEITIADVPVSADSHITLKGDSYSVRLINGGITLLQLSAGQRRQKVI